jgi:hypothetical protein
MKSFFQIETYLSSEITLKRMSIEMNTVYHNLFLSYQKKEH